MHQNYEDGINYLESQGYERVDPVEFYREIFPNNENSWEHHMDYSHPNALYLYCEDISTKKLRRRVMYNDTWEDDYYGYVAENPMTLCSGLSYRGNANKIAQAQRMNALIVDLDGVGLSEFQGLFSRFYDLDPKKHTFALPVPTFMALSGYGIHVYYVFEEPIDLFPNIKLQMNTLKNRFTFRLWDTDTSQEKQQQFQSINQGFRMVGSINAKYGTEIIAYRTGKKVTLEHLNSYVPEEYKVDVNRPFRPSKITRIEAMEKYPEWYQRVVVEGNRRMPKWNIGGQKGHNGDELYKWWMNRVKEIVGGHRYFFMMCLAIYATKCDIPKERLERDIQDVFDVLVKVKHGDNILTQDDVKAALEAYSKEYYNFTIKDIELLTDLRIERNRRNGRKQDFHLRLARGQLAIMKESGEASQGRPSAEMKVKLYRENYPEAKIKDCIKNTGLSQSTVYKWWNEE
jgi:hypothetical protein